MDISKFRVRVAALPLALGISLAPAAVWEAVPAASAIGAAGASVSVAADGTFTVDFSSPQYRFGGQVGQPVTDITQRTGSDRTGSYTEVDFSYPGRTGSIRAYQDESVVLFGTTYTSTGANIDPFPVLSSYPALPYQQSYHGCFAASQFNSTAGAADSPWLFFDENANGFLLSPASHFAVAHTWRTDQGGIATGIDPAISRVPVGTTQQTLLVASHGINNAYQVWGNALTNLQGKQRPSNEADVTLDKLGYWTDNGATYYYKYDPSLGYVGTLQAVKRDWDAQGIPMGYMQLDSWFYPKGPNAQWNDGADGEYLYEAAPDLFPNDLSGFQKSIGVPLVTHARWIDPSSPYHSQYAMSGQVVTDPAFWDDRMGYLANSGVATYEQDWLCSGAQPAYNFTDRDTFENNMAQQAAAHGLTLQYCLPYPRDLLQASEYSNLTTTRVSNDRFERSKWDAELYTSQLASAVGAWPWTDVFMSTETRNLLLANLSAGPVGVGDAIGAENKANLMQVARPDGVLVKPDVPLTPTDATYVGEAAGQNPAMVAATHTDHETVRDAYVYAYARNTPTLFKPDAVYQAEDATLSGPVVATDHTGYTGTGFADYQHNSGDYVQWNVQAPADGTYTLAFRYANGGTANRPLDVAVNGTSVGSQPFAPTTSWDDWGYQAVVVNLHAGTNTVRATATGASGGNVDYLGVSAGVVTPADTPPGPQGVSFTPSSLGVGGAAYVYDYFAGTGTVVPAGQAYHTAVDHDGSYYLVVPVNRSGIAFLGDAGKFVSLGRQRITQLHDDGSVVQAGVSFTPGEGAVTMHGYSAHPVTVLAGNGSVSGLSYDAATHLFTFQIRPNSASTASFVIR